MSSMFFGVERKWFLLGVVIVLGVTLAVFSYFSAPEVVAPTMESVATTSVEALPATSTTSVVVEDFEGEADSNVMALDMKPWKWVSAKAADGALTTPTQVDAFSITFNASGAFSAETDCNGMSGSYEARNGNLSLGSIASTKMFCEGSQEAVFAQLLNDVTAYRFTNKGQLIMVTTTGTEVTFR